MKKLPLILSISLFFFLCSGFASAGFFPLPARTITLDGNASDWDGISPILSDPSGDSTGGLGTDIKSVYLAQDSNYVYWRMDIYDAPFDLYNEANNRPRGPGIVFYSIDVNHNYLGGVTEQPWGGAPGYSYISRLQVAPWSWIPKYAGNDYGIYDAIFEGKIPVEIFNGIEVNFLLAWYHAGDPNVLVDRTSKYVAGLIPVAPVPEPATIWLLALGLAGLGFAKCRKQ